MNTVIDILVRLVLSLWVSTFGGILIVAAYFFIGDGWYWWVFALVCVHTAIWWIVDKRDGIV